MATERATHSLPIEKFRLGFHNLDKYIPLFEDAVELSCNPTTDERKKELCKKWFLLIRDVEAIDRFRFRGWDSSITKICTKS